MNPVAPTNGEQGTTRGISEYERYLRELNERQQARARRLEQTSFFQRVKKQVGEKLVAIAIPAMQVAASFSGATEIHPGTFSDHDLPDVDYLGKMPSFGNKVTSEQQLPTNFVRAQDLLKEHG